MIEKIQRLKILIVLMLIFSSSLVILNSVVKSAPLDDIYECTPFIDIDYNQSLVEQPVLPYDEPRMIPLTVKAKIFGSQMDLVAEKLKGVSLIVKISIEDVPDGCFASINPPILKFNATEEFDINYATLSFTIDKYLNAFSIKKVKIVFDVERLGKLVIAKNYCHDVSFIVGYQPQLSFSYPENNVRDITPMDTAVFPIEIENWGNSVTNVKTEVVDVPEGWQASILESIILNTNLFGNETIGKVSLKVKPPISFGYHEDREIIKVKMTPTTEFKDSEFKGEPVFLYFVVQSRGFATPGFEMCLMIFAFIFVCFIVSKRKTTKKNHRGRKK